MEAAMAASKQYGATSPEAQAAWEVVDELQFGADNSEAMRGGFDQECAVDDIDGACQDYEAKMQELKTLLGSYKSQFAQLQTLSQDLSSLKMGVNTAVAKQLDTPEQTAALKQALADAKTATAEHGVTSSEAKLAWEAVEELAAANMGAAMQPSLDKECLVEQANDACKALDELAKALESYQQN
jgi:cysteinyl-tRNA synthetase